VINTIDYKVYFLVSTLLAITLFPGSCNASTWSISCC